MKIYHDGGHGVTETSKTHFKTYSKGVVPTEVNVRATGTFTFEFLGTRSDGETILILESGFNCGYRGEGPHGTLWALERVGLSRDEIAEIIFTHNFFAVDFTYDTPRITTSLADAMML